MSAQRRQTRIQGGWAGNAASNVRTSSGQSSCNAANSSLQQNTAAVWQQKTAATDGSLLKFQPQQTLAAQPEIRIIDSAGMYDISSGPNGVSRLRLIPGFIESSECESLLETLIHELQWHQETVVRPDETYIQPRMTAWFGELPYSYSGITHPGNAQWLPVVKELRERIEANTQLTFNSLLANMYRDGHDHVAWHSDEPSLGPEPIIASLSFGDTRNFELRKKPAPGALMDEHLEYCKVPLDDGSLLIMEGATQRDWEHRVPREYHDRSVRVNLTYRTILPESYIPI